MPISIDITTNGVLVDDEWAALCRWFCANVTVSIDGPASVHDADRDLQGRPTHARVVAGIETLRSPGIERGILAVCDPASSPSEVLRHLVDELGCVESTCSSRMPRTMIRRRRPARWAVVPIVVRRLVGHVRGDRAAHPLIDAAIRALSGSWSGVE